MDCSKALIGNDFTPCDDAKAFCVEARKKISDHVRASYLQLFTLAHSNFILHLFSASLLLQPIAEDLPVDGNCMKLTFLVC